MAHNLNITNGKVSFASVGKAWHGLGTVLTEKMDSYQALTLGGLDYEVVKVPSFIEFEGRIETGEFSTLRTDTKQVLGNIGKQYTILQNKDAFSFFDAIIDRDEAIYESAGALGKGERIFLTAKLPEYIRIGKDDLIEMFVVLTNSHDGRTPAQAIITPVRVVCQNTLVAALQQAKDRVILRHTLNLPDKLAEAYKVLNLASRLTEEMSGIFKQIQGVKISDAQAEKILSSFLGAEGEKISTRKENQLSELFNYYHTGLGQERIVGTGWGIYNAMTGYLDHVKTYKNESTKMGYILSGDSNRKALQLVLAEV